MRKATRLQTRNHNTRLDLKTIYDQEGISRADIARATQGLLESVETAVQGVLAQSRATKAGLAGVGLGVPGLVHRDTGVVRMAVNLNLSSYPLGSTLAAHLGAPVIVENDARLAALGLYHQLHRPQAQNPVKSLAYVTVGTGISAGAFVTMTISLVVFFFLQRYFVRGLLAGSVKG